MPDLPIAIRALSADTRERALVRKTWIGSHRSTWRFLPSDIHDKTILPAVSRAIEALPVWVACNPDCTEQVYAWACAEPDRALIHYLFAKSRFRGFGLGLRLLAEIVKESGKKLTATHWTRDWQDRVAGCELVNGFRPDRFQPFEENR